MKKNTEGGRPGGGRGESENSGSDSLKCHHREEEDRGFIKKKPSKSRERESRTRIACTNTQPKAVTHQQSQ